MGCGQSRMGMVYPRKWKTRNEKRKGSKSDKLGADDSEYDEDNAADVNGDSPHGSASRLENGAGRRRYNAPNSSRTHRPITISGPILAQAELSNSQLEFFRMLDEKIESGKDYESEEDANDQTRKTLEKTRMAHLNPILQYHDPYLQQLQQQRYSNRLSSEAQTAGETLQTLQQDAQLTPQSPLSSWPNGSLTNYEGEGLVSRGLRSPLGREPRALSEESAKPGKSAKSDSRSKSWFSEPYNGWSLRKLRDDKDKSSNSKSRAVNAKDPSKRKSVA